MKGKDLIPDGYIPFGELRGIPMEIIERMLECQYELTGCASLESLEVCSNNSFNFARTIDGVDFWNKVLVEREYRIFFDRYPELRYVYKVKGVDLIKGLLGFPIEVVQKMVDNQYMQIGVSNVFIFQNDVTAGRGLGGFYWHETIEGEAFWRGVIEKRDFESFFKSYPKAKVVCDNVLYKVKDEDLIASLKDIPREIVQLMVRRQFEQTGKCDISVFQEDCSVGVKSGGFAWHRTEEGRDAWNIVTSNTDLLKSMVPVLRNAFQEKRPTYVYVTNSSSVGDPNVYERKVLVAINNGTAYTWADISKIEDITKATRVVRWDHHLSEEGYDMLKNGIVELTIEEIEKKLKLNPGSLKIKE